MAGSLDRRSFLKTLTLLGAAGRPSGSAAAGPAGPVFPGRRSRAIGIQLYSVRSLMARDFEGTLGRLAALGYQEVEFAGYFDRRPREVKSILDRYGLVAPSAHCPIDLVRRDAAGMLDAANVIGHRYIVIPWLPAEDRRTLDDYKRAADELNRLGVEAKRAGVRVAYHNHDSEFVPVDGRIPYDLLLSRTLPAFVAFELDLMWIAKGGQDPLGYFARYPGRFEMVHVKDSTGAPEYRQVNLGTGTIDFQRIFARAEQAGIRHAFAEHDDPANPLGFARASYAYLKQIRPGG